MHRQRVARTRRPGIHRAAAMLGKLDSWFAAVAAPPGMTMMLSEWCANRASGAADPKSNRIEPIVAGCRSQPLASVHFPRHPEARAAPVRRRVRGARLDPLQVICLPRQVPSQKIFRLTRRANHWHFSARPVLARGTFGQSSPTLGAGCDGREPSTDE